MPRLTVAQIAEICAGAAEGDTRLEIVSVNTLDDADEAQISFVGSERATAKALQSSAGCLIVSPSFDNITARTVIRVQDPRVAFARITSILHPVQKVTPGIHPSAVIALSAQIAGGCSIGPLVTIGENAVIGQGAQIKAGCVIENGVIIGNGCILYPNVTIYSGAKLGDRVVLHSGCVIGADGFGFAFAEDHYEKFPQIGSVQIDDDVELGANTCVDRAALGVTRIGKGTKLDNMVHVAHNCQIGRHVVVAAQTGFSGGVVVGDYAIVGGQVGVGDKATIQSKAVVGSGAGILTSKVVRAGEPVWGTPARPLKQHLQQLAAISRLPAVLREIKDLGSRVQALEKDHTA
jgi:UDP-3-O-[3-hydroxymyristoyl] glucosamine N-acyltransferase